MIIRSSIHAARTMPTSELEALLDPNMSIKSTVPALRIDPVPKYKTKWAFFWGAAAIQIVCVLFVGMTFWGYWRLGRTVSFSPLEIAKAFDAPAFLAMPSNTQGQHIAKHIGSEEVKYGAIVIEGGEDEITEVKRRLLFGDPGKVYRPMDTYEFDP